MGEYDEIVKEYWDKRYSAEGKIWGEKPSFTAYQALELFHKAKVKSILIPGSGYGRHTMFFSKLGFKVTGVDISQPAVNMARQFDHLSHFHIASVLDMSFDRSKYDAVYCFNVLHLLREKERAIFIQGCTDRLKSYGLMFFTVFSEKEEDFGKGVEIEKNTFESRPGRPAHYFTEDDLRQHFTKYHVIDNGVIQETEDHGGKQHIHFLRYICVDLSR